MKSVLIIGMGRFGRHVAMQLTDLGHEVMAVDKEERRINACLDYVTNAQIGNSTNAEFLNFDVIDKYRDFGGIRIEDDVLITQDGARFLGRDIIPYHIEDIEEFMAKNRYE